jgi:hypothetical protein
VRASCFSSFPASSSWPGSALRIATGLLFDEGLFLIAAVSVALSSWVALVLAEIGVFSLPRAALRDGRALGAGRAGRGRAGKAHPAPPTLDRAARARPALVVLALALALQTRPSEYVVGGRDPGTYIAGMALIARTGGVAYVDPVVLSIPRADVGVFYRADGPWGRFMGCPSKVRRAAASCPSSSTSFRPSGPISSRRFGVRGALAAPCVFGVLGTLAVLLAWRRVFGNAVGLDRGRAPVINVFRSGSGRRLPGRRGPLSQFLVYPRPCGAFALWKSAERMLLGLLGERRSG